MAADREPKTPRRHFIRSDVMEEIIVQLLRSHAALEDSTGVSTLETDAAISETAAQIVAVAIAARGHITGPSGRLRPKRALRVALDQVIRERATPASVLGTDQLAPR